MARADVRDCDLCRKAGAVASENRFSGYAGDLSVVETWTLLSGDAAAQLVDVRTRKARAAANRLALEGVK